MSPHDITTQTLTVAMKTVTLILGGLITYLAYKAHRRTGARPLRLLTIGFGIVTVGSLTAGVIDQVLGTNIHVGILVESTLFALGFAVIVYSLYVTEG